jgi:amino acid adenylation domain-containing protein
MGAEKRLDQLAMTASQRVKEKRYWLKNLSGLAGKYLFPYDHTKKTGEDRDMGEKIFEFSAPLSSASINMGGGSDVRLHMILAAGVSALLYRYIRDYTEDDEGFISADGCADVVTGTPILRPDITKKGGTGGDFINTVLVLRNRLKPRMRFKELLLDMKRTVSKAVEYRNYPLEIIAQQLNMPYSPGEDFPLFDVAVLLENIHDKGHIRHLNVNMEFSFIRRESSLQGCIRYNRLVYKESTIGRIISMYTQFLEFALANVDLALEEVDILSAGEREQLLEEFNRREQNYPGDKTLHGLFEERAVRTPKGIAVKDTDESAQLSYEELNRKAGQLANRLRCLGVEPGSIVGLLVERSIDMIVGILGILKSGAAYLPINPKNPVPRKNYLLCDSHACFLVTHRGLGEDLGGLSEIVQLGDSDSFSPGPGVDGVESNLEYPEDVTGPANRGDLAYIIYTSGSTGNPKGVMVTHSNACPLIHWGWRFFGITPEDRMIQNNSYYFDWSVFEIFMTLSSGACLYMIFEDVLKNPELHVEFINRNRITLLNVTPTQCHYVLTAGNRLPFLKHLAIGAESLSVDLVKRVLEIVSEECRTYNLYGPTEATMISAALEIDRSLLQNYKALSGVPIGKPMANLGILILNNRDDLCPVEVAGELCVSGDGVARGYLNRPELTAEKFVSSPFTHHPSPLYRTGDRARWLADGTIEFLGRVDDQVKVRGFRIEPGEIEKLLLAHAFIKEALVMAREYESGERYLCAYIVSESGVNRTVEVQQLREYLSADLPDYMVPQYFVLLEKMPLNPNGKVDRKALPEPDLEVSGESYTAPGTEVEEKLTAIWSEVLGIEQRLVGIDHDFFRLGGHSLKATTLVYRIYKSLEVNLEIEDVFVYPTIRELASRIGELEQTAYLEIEPVEKREYYRLSFAQRRLWVLYQLDMASVAYNLPAVLKLQGSIQKEKLEQVFLSLIERHESLRTSFTMKGGDPVQQVHSFEEVSFEIEHYKYKPGLYSACIDTFIRSFDLSQAPLLRVGLGESEENGSREHLLLVDMHHIVSDGVSVGVLVREFLALYHGQVLPALRIQFKDYALWQQGGLEQQRLKNLEAYWLSQLKGEIPVLNLPVDYPRPVVRKFEGSSTGFVLGFAETGALKQFAASGKATLYMVLLAVTAIFFSKLGGQEEVIVGTPVAGRCHADLESVIGMFVNTLALKTHPRGDFTPVRFLQQIKTTALGAFDNQEYPFEKLVEHKAVNLDTSRNPLFDVMFTLQNVDIPEPYIPGLTLKPVEFETHVSKFDMTVAVIESTREDSGCLHVHFVYNTALFKKTTVERFLHYYQAVVNAFINNPEQPISAVEIITQEEKEQVLYRFNNPEPGFHQRKPLHVLFEEQVEKTPSSTAVIEIKLSAAGRVDAMESEEVTFGILNERANRLAHYLYSQGVRPGGLVGIMIERSVEMIIAILAILKSGCGYVPVNPKEPVERVGFILQECNVKILLTRGHLLEDQPYFDRFRCIVEYHNYPRMPEKPVDVGEDPIAMIDNIAYIIFTSGSTGRPKGVPITHANISPLMHWAYKSMAISPHERVMQNLSYHFDWSVSEIFITFTSGARLYMLPDEILLNPEESVRFINRAGITVMHVTPTQWQCLVNVGKPVKSLNYLFIGAEKLTYDLVQRSYRLVGSGCRVFNLYGPTEATITAAMQEIDPNRMDEYKRLSSVPIGLPAANLQLYILDNHANLCPVSLVGELYIFGDGVASGYLNRPELTAEKFGSLNKSYMSYKSDKTYTNKANLYRTGDLARWLPGGAIEFLGRIDHQVKIRGHRIELGEVENQLLTHPAVKEAVVTVKGDSVLEKKLCAFIVIADDFSDRTLTAGELRKHLMQTLPLYMVPAVFTRVENIPYKAAGKVDLQSLLEKVDSSELDNNFQAPSNELENRLATIWCEVLGIQRVGVNDSLIELGGHSVSAIRLSSRIHAEFDVDVPLRDLFRTGTIIWVADQIVHRHSKIKVHAQQNRSGALPSLAAIRLTKDRRKEEDM